MAKGAYIGVSSKARKLKQMYIGVAGVARKVKKAYVGVNGKARLFWSGETTWAKYTTLNSYTDGSDPDKQITDANFSGTSVGYNWYDVYWYEDSYGRPAEPPIINGEFVYNKSDTTSEALAKLEPYTTGYPEVWVGRYPRWEYAYGISRCYPYANSTQYSAPVDLIRTAHTYRGDFVEYVTSDNPDAFPKNGGHDDGYWYVKQ